MKRLASFALVAVIAFATSGCKTPGRRLTSTEENDLRSRAIEALRRAVRFKAAGSIRAAGIEVMQRHLGESAYPRIRLALRDDEPGVQFAAILATGRLRDHDSLAKVRAFADDENPSLRIAAYFAMHRLGDTTHTGELAEMLLYAPEATVRRDAAYVLGLLEEPEAIKLLARAMRDKDESVRRQAIESLAMLGNPEAVQQLTFAASSGLAASRVAAIDTLANLEKPELVGTFQYKFKSGEYIEIRLAAARGLGKLGVADGFDFALRSLEFNRPMSGVPQDTPQSQIARVRQAAALALGAIRDRRALPALRKQLNDSFDPRVQLAAADAILDIIGPSVGVHLRTQKDRSRSSARTDKP
jgi:HEAT repeat protein